MEVMADHKWRSREELSSTTESFVDGPQDLALPEGNDVSVAIAHEQLSHVIDPVDRSFNDIGLLRAQLCGELIHIRHVDIGIKRFVHDGSIGPRDRSFRWPNLSEHDVHVVALDHDKAWWDTKELVEGKAQDIAIELCSRKHVIYKEVRD
jgi:hypothetical protein